MIWVTTLKCCEVGLKNSATGSESSVQQTIVQLWRSLLLSSAIGYSFAACFALMK